MTLIHSLIEVRRTLKAPPARVFAAWQDTRALEQWSSPGDDGWTAGVTDHAFEVGGLKRIVFGPPGEEPYVEESRYLDIVRDAYIINSERILKGPVLISASLITLEFAAAAGGCDLFVTDQITLLSPTDDPENRRRGWGEVLGKLQGFVETA